MRFYIQYIKIHKFLIIAIGLCIVTCISFYLFTFNNTNTIIVGSTHNQAALTLINAYNLEARTNLDNINKHLKVGVIDTPLKENIPFNNNIVNLTPHLISADSHGYMVTSLLSAQFNIGNKYNGLIPGLKVFYIGLEEMDALNLAIAIQKATDENIKFLNISLGTYKDEKVLRDAVSNAISKGMIIVSSSGNNSINQLNYPSAYPGVISVGALDNNGGVLGISNVNSKVDIFAPGFQIACLAPDNHGDISYNFTGTSSATVFVTALAILIKVNHPHFTSEEVRSHMFDTSTNYNASWKGQDIRIKVVNYQKSLL